MESDLMADHCPVFEWCPRCGIGALEMLRTHSHCINCNYFELLQEEVRWAIPQWVTEACS